MKQIKSSILTRLASFSLAVFCFGLTASAQEGVHTEDLGKAKWSLGINVGVIPSVDFGYGVGDNLSLHLKGGYMPNFFKAPETVTGWFVAPTARWWIYNNEGFADRFYGLYAETGLFYSSYNLYLPKIITHERGAGFTSTGAGVMAGFGYAIKVSRHFTITPNLSFGISLYSKASRYRMFPEGEVPEGYEEAHLSKKGQYTKAVTMDQSGPGLPFPLDCGIKFSYVF